MTQLKEKQKIDARPFLKWAGGKTQLIDAINERLPEQIKETGIIENYVEPFIGGGAVFFFLKSNYQVNNAYLFDINKELVIAYNVIKLHHSELIKHLSKLEENYLNKNNDERKIYYYETRDNYNEQMNGFDYDKYNYSWIVRTAYLIFLNKTCFNGLYRVNQKGEFNVPHGRYKNPTICDRKNLIAVNKALQNAEIICGDFIKAKKIIKKNTFVYLDPPYRPLNGTASFTSYCKEGFDEKDQKRLARFYKEMDKRDSFLMLSNSDPKNENPEDEFFDDLYREYLIDRVPAKRFINCDASRRGEIQELIIRNYDL